MGKNIKNRGAASLAVTLVGSLIGLGLLTTALFGNNNLSFANKENLYKSNLLAYIGGVSGSSLEIGSKYALGVSGDGTLYLYKGGEEPANVLGSLIRADGYCISQSGSYCFPWEAGKYGGEKGTFTASPASDYYICLLSFRTNSAGSIVECSSLFSLVSPVTQPSIKVLSPNGGETLQVGTSFDVRWESVGDVADVYIYLVPQGKSVDFGCLVKSATNAFDLGHTTVYWDSNFICGEKGGTLASGQYYLYLTASNPGQSPSATAKSNGFFTITAPTAAPTVTLTASPASITSGQSSTLTLSSTNAAVCSGANVSDGKTNGTSVVYPTQTTTYTVNCWEYASMTNSGRLATASVTVSVTAPKPTCTPSTSCVPTYCKYGGDLKNCTVINADCSTSSYTTGSCNSAPPPPPPPPPPGTLSCDATAKAILNSVGGCSQLNTKQYPNIDKACCTLVTKETLLDMLEKALQDGRIDEQEKADLLRALDNYLSARG